MGAHYDTIPDTPGADDNASGVAGVLELARLAVLEPSSKTVRFVAFTLEEPPLFRTRHMGSYVYAKSLKKEKVKVKGMISLEMIGYYCDRKGCQYYPFSFFKWFYPNKGDFIAFVGNVSSKAFTKRVKDAFMQASTLPVESLNTVSIVPGIDFSDHSSFWKFGFPAFMVTDTAFFRNPYYHSAGDIANTLDFKRMALLIYGLKSALIPSPS
jgi:Zn-dependent M28 family amino/carboxypeptidase